MERLLSGNAAAARGAYEAGVRVVSSYPGTPATEITELIGEYDGVYAEWAPNEKAAFETAYGASLAGARAMSCMKHVGVNVAADALFTAAYTGVRGGLVVVAADDPGMHSSQNEQDSRMYAKSAHIPMLEPSDSAEAREFMRAAFKLSEEYDTPVFVRLTTRVAHSRSLVSEQAPERAELIPYEKNAEKYVMIPAHARVRRMALEARMARLSEDVNDCKINRAELRSRELGVVCAGGVYEYVREALPDASVYKAATVYPLPLRAIEKFSQEVKRLVVVEELEPFIETELKARGIACEGKSLFGAGGEYSVSRIRQSILGIPAPQSERGLPSRPPVLCAGCPHRPVLYALKKLGLKVFGDIGCYSLGALPPLSALDAMLCMGASVSMAHGAEKAHGRDYSRGAVAVIGDSTFMHSGITALIGAAYNGSNLTLLILDNGTTAMTGHQQNPSTGKALCGFSAPRIDLVKLCEAAGAASVRVEDAYDLSGCEKAIREETQREGVSVIIARRPCALITSRAEKPYRIDGCHKCGMCLEIGCPAIRKEPDGASVIDENLCSGCGVCAQLCAFDAISIAEKEA